MNEVHFYCVIDFEGTCEKDNPKDYIHEIIEFPAVLVDAATLEVVSKLCTIYVAIQNHTMIVCPGKIVARFFLLIIYLLKLIMVTSKYYMQIVKCTLHQWMC